jgi:diguanylate cyclase (GGDEF)-like protein/PAS domain S-box-containing protein
VEHDVTAQHSLARQLRAEHEFARQVMQTMGEGLTVTDAAGRFTFVNDAYARLFGYAPADLIGRSPIELTIDDDRAALDAARTARAEGRSSTYPARLRRADNQIVDVQVTGTPRFVDGEFAGSIAVVTDLSERVARERALHAAEQTLRSFFDSAGVMMGIVEVKDEDIRHITDNALAASFFGTTVTEMRGQWASTIGIPPETRARWLEAYRQSAALGGPVHFETVHRTTGGVRWFAATVCPLGSGELGGTRYSYVATDVTAQKRTEQQLRVAQGHLESANTQLRELARTDGLTRLANRTAFDQELTAEVARATRYPAPLSVLLIDIDAFKPYNDVYGHQAGDAVLRTVGLIFQEQSRQNDLAARYGGEEFAIILPNTDEAESVLVAERIRRSVERTAWPQRGITVSIGVVTFQPPMVTEELIKLADAALYAAKAQGRNRVVHAGVLPPQPAVA